MVRNGRPSRFSTSSARPVMRSCSAADCSGVVMLTSSTLGNWCWRIMPLVSLPAAPASERKHGVQAVKRSGRSFSSSSASFTRLVSGTSAVGISQKPLSVWNMSSAKRGSWPTP